MQCLKSKIEEIGSKMVCCSKGCCGIANKLAKGILPRCLFLQQGNNNSTRGVVAIGINPGKIKNKKERQHYKANWKKNDNKHNYNLTVDYIKEHRIGYYTRIKQFLECIDFSENILWTELVKCENQDDILPLQTYRNCIHEYLLKELKLVPNWPVFCFGKESYKLTAILLHDRKIIGVPHPNSRDGLFNKQLETLNNRKVRDILKNNKCEAIWLPDLF